MKHALLVTFLHIRAVTDCQEQLQ